MSIAQRLTKDFYSHQTLQTLIDRKGRYFDYRSNFNYFKDDNLWNEKIARLLRSHGYRNFDKLILNQFDDLLFGGTPTLLQKRQHYYQTKVKFCPHCLYEAKYHRLLWDVSLVSVCLKHKCNLIENCPSCGRHIRIHDLIGGACTCGLIYANVVNTKTPVESVLSAQKVIQSLLTGKKKNIRIEGNFSLTAREYFAGLDMFSKLLDGFPAQLLSFDNLEASFIELNYNLIRGDKRDLEMINFISTIAHELLVSPSKHLASIVEAIELKRATKRTIRGKREIFDRMLANGKFEAHKKIYSDYHNTSNQEFARMKTVMPNELKYCSLVQARKILQCDDITIAKFVQLGLLQFVEGKFGSRKIMLVEKESVVKLAQRRKELLDVSQVAKLFDITGGVVRAIAKRNLLKMEHGKEKDGYGRRLFHPTEVYVLIKEVEKQCVQIPEDSLEWVPFRYRELLNRHYHFSYAQTLEAILSGRFSCGKKTTSIQTLEDVYLYLPELTKMLAKKQGK
ncbi:hypothetical protein FPZ49_15390 [Paenibacillus cremeus]|uniref:TniQ domain-containing protein n=2 Tax=Paenibacillus cremeus TaxID=2163881 RepID=A0A559KAE6_9BACL|nr:hypothetical protein FPZ49_15390 [Paenibacillus cremeus]